MENNVSRRLLLLGGGGHCRSVLDSLRKMGVYDEIGLVKQPGFQPDSFDIPLVGSDDDLPELLRDGWQEAFIAVGSIGSTHNRKRLCKMLENIGFTLPVIIDPSAVIAENTEIGAGTYVGKRAVINAGTRIGNCAIINTGAIIEHDCRIGNFVHVSPGVILCGQVSVGDHSHIGAGASVKQQVTIGKHTMIGLGSVVIKDIPDHVTAYGNPCKAEVK